MGSSVSKAKQSSKQDVEKIYKVLLLGPFLLFAMSYSNSEPVFEPLWIAGAQESGKTTVFKQLEIMHKGDFSETVLASYRPIIYSNVLLSAQELITYMEESGLKWAEYSNKVCRPIKFLFLKLQLKRPGQKRFSTIDFPRMGTRRKPFPTKLQRPSTSYGKTPSCPNLWRSMQSGVTSV